MLSWPSLWTLWKTRSKWDICVESAVFVVSQVLFSCFHVLFMYFSWKVRLFIQKVPLSWKLTKPAQCVYTCIIYTYMQHMHHQIPPKYDIPSWPSLCTLWKSRSKWDICVESAVFVVSQVLFHCFHVLFTYFSWKVQLFIQKCHFSWKLTKPAQRVYTCIIYAHMQHMHHQIPPKYKIYLVGLPSVLYERADQNEISVLNQLFLLFLRFFSIVFMYFSRTFHEKCSFSYKKCHFHEN